KLNNFIEKDNFVDSIIKELLIHSYHSYPLFQQALADKLFTSLSSLKKLLPNVIKKIEKYNLSLRADNQDGLLLVGNEEEIRQAIKFFLIDESSSSVNYPDVILPVDHFEKINKEIDSLSSMHTIKLTDDAKRNLGMNILIAISRTEINKFIHYEQEEISNIERTEEYKMALTLQDNLQKLIGNSLENETHYIAKNIITSGKLHNFNINYSEVDINWIIDSILKSIVKRTSINFQNDSDLKTGLSIHLNVAFNRIKFKTKVKNDSLNTIKSDYPVAFELAII